MRLLGLAVIVGGWLISMSGLFISSSNGVRCLFALLGIAVSLIGNLGILNRYYLARAIWKN